MQRHGEIEDNDKVSWVELRRAFKTSRLVTSTRQSERMALGTGGFRAGEAMGGIFNGRKGDVRNIISVEGETRLLVVLF